MRGVIGAGLAVCIGFGGASPCSRCRVEDVWIAPPDGRAVRARLYVPAVAEATLPAVVICHGYLANMGFVENPWAADLSRLGVVSLFLDRRGHGRSGGAWWPTPAPRGLSELYPEVAAAVEYLRTRVTMVDPSRIALLGHSDGGTAAMVAASADWEIAATVSLSASLARWEYVNHVAPRNLLLLYGREDRYILGGTDLMLMKNATRGYVAGEGMFGHVEDGTARKLVRVPGSGHADLIWSEAARREALGWLAATFGISPPGALAPLRLGWVAAGAGLLLLLVACWNGLPGLLRLREGWVTRVGQLLLVSGVWVAGLAAAAWVARKLDIVPVQEGRVVASVLGLEALAMGILASLRGAAPRLRVSHLSEAGRGALAGLLAQAGAEAVFRPMYSMPYSPQRMMLALFFAGFALPAVAATASAAMLVGGGRVARGISIEMILGLLTAALAPVWFVRMSILPVMVLGFCLLLAGAYRMSGASTARMVGFGTVTFARSAAVVCAFY